jgi:hypothetical protein
MAMKGILDFLEMFDNHETDPSFACYAVKAPFTDVTQKFFARHDCMMREQNAPKHQKTDDMLVDDTYGSYAVVEVLDSEWTIVLESVFDSDGNDEEARSISETLQTRSLAIIEGDHGIRYDLFENGSRIEYLDHGGAVNFESQIRDQPTIRQSEEDEDWLTPVREFINEVFVQEGIYVPACYPQIADGVYLVVEAVSESFIGRVDIIYADHYLPRSDED